MKIKVSESWGHWEDRDLHRTAPARRVMGEAAELHFDANGGYTRKQAVRMAAAMTRPAHGRPPGRCPPTRAWAAASPGCNRTPVGGSGGSARAPARRTSPAAPPGAPVQLRLPSLGSGQPFQFAVAGPPYPRPHAVVGEDLQAVDIVDNLAVRLCRRTARVVADQPADGAVRMGGGPVPVLQAVLGQLPVQVVQDNARLDHAAPVLQVHRKQTVAVLALVHHHREVAALAGQARAAPTGQPPSAG